MLTYRRFGEGILGDEQNNPTHHPFFQGADDIGHLGAGLIAPFASDTTSPNHSSGISGNKKLKDRQEPGYFAADGSAVASAIFGSSRRGPREGRPKTGSTSADNFQENRNRFFKEGIMKFSTRQMGMFTLFGMFLFLFASLSYSQTLTGSIKGIVTDESGIPLPGVTVEISSPALIGGVNSQITTENGFYRSVNLPPGIYKIVFSLEGFKTVERLNIKVSVKAAVTEDLVMQQAAIKESITVIAEAPILDVTDSGMSSRFDKDLLEKIPSGRNSFLDVVKQTPGIVTNSGSTGDAYLSGFGSNQEANSFQMDGLDIARTRLGDNYLFPNQELFSEVEVSGAGNPAEYGGFSGVVVNVVTKSGGNSFSGLLSYYGQFDSLTGDNNPDPEKYDSMKRNVFNDFVFSLGGPIIKDRLWFFGSGNIVRDDETSWRMDPQYHMPTDSQYYFLKLTFQAAKKHKIVGSFGYRKYVWGTPAGPYRTKEATYVSTTTLPNWNILYTWIMGQNTFLELKTSGFDGKESQPNNPGSTLDDPVHMDLLTGVLSNAQMWPSEIYEKRSQAHVSISHFADNFLGGKHEFKLGIQYNIADRGSITGYSGGKLFYDYGGEKYLLYEQAPFYYGGTVKNIGVFLEDSWTIGRRLTFNLGLRYDNSRGDIPSYDIYEGWRPIPGQKTKKLKDIVAWNMISPRIGFVFQLTSDRKTILKGNYGLYYEALSPGKYEWPGPNATDWTASWWNGSEWEVYNFVPGAGGFNIDPNLKPIYCNQFYLGVEREVFPGFSVGLSGVYKIMKGFAGLANISGIYETVPMVSPDNGQTYNVQNQINVGENRYITTNPKGHEQSYKGLILNLNKRYSNNWLFNASVTLSRSEGYNNISAGVDAYWQLSTMDTGGNYRRGKDPNDWLNSRGLMQHDRTWVLKAQFGYTLPLDILASVNYQYMTGRPYTSRVRVYPDQGMRKIIAEPVSGENRFPPINMLDFRMEKTFLFGNRLRFSAMLDVFNLLNVNPANRFASIDSWSSAYLEPSVIPLARRAQVGIKVEF